MEQSRNNLLNGNTPGNPKEERFQPDTTKIVHRHLEDKEHIITDEEIRSVRISTELPPFDEVTTGAEAATNVIKSEQEEPSDRPVTPWNTVE